MHAPDFTPFWRRLLGGALLLAAPLLGWAQQPTDPPGRVAYISAQEGTALIAMDGSGAWSPAALNWPVTTGTRLAAEAGSRTELHGGWTALRLHGKSSLDVTRLDDDTLQVALTEGSLSARVRDLQPGERVELDTPQLALVAEQPGEYRIDVDPRVATTRVTVHSGLATLYGEAGQSTTIGAGQQISFAGRGLGVVQSANVAHRDGFDQWVAAREALEERSRSARYLSRDMPGYQSLDGHGEWAQDATYGSVWYPSVMVQDWAPYRHGQWAWIDPWGWTWVDDAPWGFAPFHYGRWAQIGPRWAWVPGPVVPRPVYAPALVAFVGGSGGGTSWGISLGSGLPGAAWFPLAPGEYWEPHYHASPRYRRRLNRWDDQRERVRPPPDSFYFQRRPHAITVAPHDQFGGGDRHSRRPRYGDGSRLPSGAIKDSRVIAPPPRAFVPGMQTQAPLPVSRPPLASQPRRPRIGAERGTPPRFDGERPRPGPDMRRTPGFGEPGDGRLRREPIERERTPSLRPGPDIRALPQQQPQQQRQLQREQEERVRQLRTQPRPGGAPIAPTMSVPRVQPMPQRSAPGGEPQFAPRRWEPGPARLPELRSPPRAIQPSPAAPRMQPREFNREQNRAMPMRGPSGGSRERP